MDFFGVGEQNPFTRSRSVNRWLNTDFAYADQALINAGVLKGKAKEDAEKTIKEGTKNEETITPVPVGEGNNENKDSGTDGEEVVTTVPTPSTAMTMEDYGKFAARFEGLQGLDVLKEDIEAGTYAGGDLTNIDASFFNDNVRDYLGNLPGGYSRDSGFFSSGGNEGYVRSLANEPADNPKNSDGIQLWQPRTLIDGTVIWEENPAFSDDDGVGSAKSIERTRMLTESMRQEELAARGVETATSILTRLVGAFGLPESTVGKLKQFMIDGLSEEAIALEVRQTEEYKERFPCRAGRRDNGFGSMTEAQYMQNEDAYEALLRTHGLPPRFYDDRMDFATLIAADVSPNEFNERVTLAELATAGADPNTKAELKRLYDVDATDLVAYYLDPESATNLIEERRSLEAAGLSATAARVMGRTVGFDRETATALQREGIQRREIQQRLSTQAGLTEQTIGEQDALSVSDVATAEFGLDPNVADVVERRRQQRVAGSAGTTGLLVSGRGATGYGAST